MTPYPEAEIQDLCRRLDIDPGFLRDCLAESVIEIQETDARLDLVNATTLRLRRLQRICHTLNVDLPVALLLNDLLQRVANLEKTLARRNRDTRI